MSTAAVTIKQVDAHSSEYKGVWQLREDVLRKPLGLSLNDEDLTSEAAEVIFVAIDNDVVIGCVMLRHITAQELKMRQMAVATQHQGKDIGRLLVNAAEQYAAQHGYNNIKLHARQVAEGFYRKLGYATTSDVFTEVDIPHVVMEKAMPI